ncbi:hypothetical protein MLD38_035053 [Melastoma candidum]|uniref:Uncharacterized protein n=1 Tax=Melastoma candidum TaxID=119954 RepID=A0ACB9MBM4_9MYRT|nr:hypothetical protein MLD38_035053 [Melastoma candidum]
MGGCFSRLEPEDPYPTAKVVSASGDLHEYPIPVTVSQVLLSERDFPTSVPGPSSSPSPSPVPSSASTGYFVCNSDGFYYEERIPALPHEEELVGNQIYFVLPVSKLEGRITATEMAALAVKASLALRKAEEKGGGGGRRRRARKASIRISPVVEVCEGVSYNEGVIMNGGYYGNERNGEGRRSGDGGVLRSVSFRKMQRVVSLKGAKAVVRPYRTRLSTIHEGTVI